MRKKWRVSRYIAIAFAILVIGVIAVAAALAVEDRRDEAITAEITRAESDLQELGAQIAAIKDIDLTSMNDFVSAFA